MWPFSTRKHKRHLQRIEAQRALQQEEATVSRRAAERQAQLDYHRRRIESTNVALKFVESPEQL